MGVVDKNSNSNSEHNHRSNGSNSGGANSNGHPSEESGTSSSGEDDNGRYHKVTLFHFFSEFFSTLTKMIAYFDNCSTCSPYRARNACWF